MCASHRTLISTFEQCKPSEMFRNCFFQNVSMKNLRGVAAAFLPPRFLCKMWSNLHKRKFFILDAPKINIIASKNRWCNVPSLGHPSQRWLRKCEMFQNGNERNVVYHNNPYDGVSDWHWVIPFSRWDVSRDNIINKTRLYRNVVVKFSVEMSNKFNVHEIQWVLFTRMLVIGETRLVKSNRRGVKRKSTVTFHLFIWIERFRSKGMCKGKIKRKNWMLFDFPISDFFSFSGYTARKGGGADNRRR